MPGEWVAGHHALAIGPRKPSAGTCVSTDGLPWPMPLFSLMEVPGCQVPTAWPIWVDSSRSSLGSLSSTPGNGMGAGAQS